MSIQTNFRAQDMIGISAPKKKAKAAPAPRVAPAAPKVEEPVVVESVATLEEVVAEEVTSNEE
jgi:hypothetical protein